MLKVVINDKYGGFGLSTHALRLIYDRNPRSTAIRVYTEQAQSEFARRPVQEWEEWLKDHCTFLGNGIYVQAVQDNAIDVRSDPTLVQVVEELGARANGNHAKLKIVRADEEGTSITEDDGLERLKSR